MESRREMKAKGWGLPFGGEGDIEHVLRGTRWADSYWLFCDNRERLIRMVNDTMEELLDLDEAPKQESLWWTGTHKHEDMKTLRVGSRGKIGDLPFREVFEVLGYHRDGKGECTLCKDFGKYKNRSRTVPMTTTCRRVHSQACSTALNGSINWLWSGGMINKVRAWEANIRRLTFRPRFKPDETWIGYQRRTAQSLRKSWRKMGFPC